MRRFPLILVLMCLIGPAGCGGPHTVHKDWVAVGGSGTTVKLAYEYHPYEGQPVTYAPQGLDLAKKYCMGWGYAGAEAFGGEVRDCVHYYPGGLLHPGGCSKYRVTKEYNCTDRQDAAVPAASVNKRK